MWLIPAPGEQQYPHAHESGDDFASSRTFQRLSPFVVPRPSLENLYVVFVLAYMSSAFQGIFTPLEEVPNGSDIVQVLLQAFIYLLAGILIAKHWRSFRQGLIDCKWAIALVGLALISALWAEDPLFAVRRAAVVAATTMFGIYFATRYRREEQVDLLCCALAVVGAMSVVMVMLFPQYGIDPTYHGSPWRGVFVHKNTLGRVMLLGAVASCCSARKSLAGRTLQFVLLAAFAALLALSRSATAVVSGAVLLVSMLTYTLLRCRLTARISIIMMILALLAVLIPVAKDHEDALLAVVGRDSTLTGRDALWGEVILAIDQRPLLGYGFDQFWRGKEGPSEAATRAVGLVNPNAHNGFLEICLDLGVIGLLIFGIGFVLRYRSALSRFWVRGDRAAMWPLAYLSFLLLYNLTESTLLRENSLYWALYAALLVRGVRAIGSGNEKYVTVSTSHEST